MSRSMTAPVATAGPGGTVASRTIALHIVGNATELLLRVVEWRLQQRTIKALQCLDDRTLKDIGLDRSEILSVVAGTGRDRRRSLPGRRPERS